MFSFYERGEFPTARKLQEELREKLGFNGSKTSVLRILKRLGFKYRRCNDGRKLLLERSDIVCARTRFLRKMHEERTGTLQRPIYYLDETWCNQNHTKSLIWTEGATGAGGLKVPSGKETG